MAPATPTPAQPPEAPTTGVAFSPQRLNSVSEEGAAPALGASKVAVVQTGALSAGARVTAAARWRSTSIKVSVTKVRAQPLPVHTTLRRCPPIRVRSRARSPSSPRAASPAQATVPRASPPGATVCRMHYRNGISSANTRALSSTRRDTGPRNSSHRGVTRNSFWSIAQGDPPVGAAPALVIEAPSRARSRSLRGSQPGGLRLQRKMRHSRWS